MKKKYHIPTTEIIAIDTKELMLPPNARMSDPPVGGANSFAFDEEENEDWGGVPGEKTKNDLWN